jgi:hypothetical protein
LLSAAPSHALEGFHRRGFGIGLNPPVETRVSDSTASANCCDAWVSSWHVNDDEEGGKASRLCPSNSDVDLFGYGESVIDFDADIPDSALDLRMPQQQLHGT